MLFGMHWGAEGRGVYRVYVKRPEDNRQLGRPRRRWEDNIKMDVRETGSMAQDRVRWRDFVSTVMILQVP